MRALLSRMVHSGSPHRAATQSHCAEDTCGSRVEKLWCKLWDPSFRDGESRHIEGRVGMDHCLYRRAFDQRDQSAVLADIPRLHISCDHTRSVEDTDKQPCLTAAGQSGRLGR